ncbi:MAG: hypothetical protein N2749_00470 [Clostridia bacterium]|nr:hypothetical protein [Clostridia bacterium]
MPGSGYGIDFLEIKKYKGEERLFFTASYYSFYSINKFGMIDTILSVSVAESLGIFGLISCEVKDDTLLLGAIDGLWLYISSLTKVEDDFKVKDFILYQNYPNPFNSKTKIRF